MRVKRKFSAVLIASILACEATASFADCRLGDLSGSWSHYIEITTPTGPETMICDDVSFTSAGSSPSRYNFIGLCKSYSTTSPNPGNTGISTNNAGTVVETRSCELTGTYSLAFQVGMSAITTTVTILDVRIEDNGTTTKTHIHGIAHYSFGGANENVMNFTFTR